MKNVLWEPKDYHYKESNISNFISYVNNTYSQSISGYDDLYQWSISDIESFWESIAKFCDIKFSSNYSSIINKKKSMLDSSWFEGAKLNFAENLLKYKDDRVALEYFCEDKTKGYITYKELFNKNEDFASEEIIKFLDLHPELVKINEKFEYM